MKKTLFSLAIMALGCSMLVGCEGMPETPEARQTMGQESQVALNSMKQQDPSLNDLLSRSYGYAIFPSVGKGGLVVGGAYGRGEVYEQGRLIGYSELTQGNIGLQAGGQEYQELIIFQTREALNNFKSGNFTFSGDASAVALKAGAAGSTQFRNGVAVITNPTGGLMFEASIGGQKFNFQPLGQNNSNMNNTNTNTNTNTNPNLNTNVDPNYHDKMNHNHIDNNVNDNPVNENEMND